MKILLSLAFLFGSPCERESQNINLQCNWQVGEVATYRVTERVNYTELKLPPGWRVWNQYEAIERQKVVKEVPGEDAYEIETSMERHTRICTEDGRVDSIPGEHLPSIAVIMNAQGMVYQVLSRENVHEYDQLRNDLYSDDIDINADMIFPEDSVEVGEEWTSMPRGENDDEQALLNMLPKVKYKLEGIEGSGDEMEARIVATYPKLDAALYARYPAAKQAMAEMGITRYEHEGSGTYWVRVKDGRVLRAKIKYSEAYAGPSSPLDTLGTTIDYTYAARGDVDIRLESLKKAAAKAQHTTKTSTKKKKGGK